MTMEHFRELTGRERVLVGHLTEPDFIGAAQIREQLSGCQARTIDPEGSFELRVKSRAPARVFFRVPVELAAKDRDGGGIHVLLHVVDGIATTVQVYKDTPAPIATWPSRWDVVVSGQAVSSTRAAQGISR
jgi:hypothetical protein